jgi:hypothetical protein
MAAIGPYSRPHRLAKLDGRTREAKMLRAIRAELAAHVGGKPSVTERMLIDRCAMLTLRLAQMDEKIAGGVLTDIDSRSYVAWSNGLARSLQALGLKPATEAPKRLAEVLAAGRAAA